MEVVTVVVVVMVFGAWLRRGGGGVAAAAFSMQPGGGASATSQATHQAFTSPAFFCSTSVILCAVLLYSRAFSNVATTSAEPNGFRCVSTRSDVILS